MFYAQSTSAVISGRAKEDDETNSEENKSMIWVLLLVWAQVLFHYFITVIILAHYLFRSIEV